MTRRRAAHANVASLRARRRSAVTALAVLAVAAGVLYWSVATTKQVTVAAEKRATPGAIAVNSAFFADGACMAFAPTHGNRHQVVFLDAGHGGIDPGAQGITEAGRTIWEADQTLPVAEDTMALLRAEGYEVVMSRTTSSTVLRLGPSDTNQGVLSLTGAHDDVAARAQCANQAKADVLVGIYFDSGSSPTNAGCLTAYDTARSFSTRNQQLAQLVDAAEVAALDSHGWQIPDAGAMSDATLGSSVGNPADGGLAAASANYNHLLLLGPAEAGYFSTPSEMPGALIEPLFVTDPFEGTIAASTTGQLAMAAGIALGIEQFLSPASFPTTTTSTTAAS